MNHRPLLFAPCAIAIACSSGTESDSGADAEPSLYSLTLSMEIQSTDGVATFLTPTASAQDMETDTIEGKLWYMAFFYGGATPGVDDPVHDSWGTVGPDLAISYTTPALFPPGPHDAVAVIYVEAEVEADTLEYDDAPVAVAGDLASFTMAEQVVEEGDPELHLAFLRLKVDDADASIAIRNKTPEDWDDDDQLLDSFTDTVLIVP